jgi:hypothetical protein
MSSTAMRVYNGTDDVQTITASINIGVDYGDTTIEKGKWGSIPCEFVWYTLNCYDSNKVLLAGRPGSYGSHSFQITGMDGDYTLSQVV